MARPKPCVLFAQSFLHPVLSEYVDEVRFTEPVVISACEFLELHASSVCSTLSLSGASFPPSFALEIFVRIGGEARFKRLCPAFLYSPSTSSILEVQAAVTDHLVIRGSYRALSLVVYGNSVKDLGQFNFDHEIDNTLSDAIIPPEAVFQPEDLPEALQDDKGDYQCKAVPPLRNLQLVSQDVEQSEVIHYLLSSAIQLTSCGSNHSTSQRVFDILLSAASIVLSEHGIESGFFRSRWSMPAAKAPSESQSTVKHSLLQARDQMESLKSQRHITPMVENCLLGVSAVLEGVFGWIHRSLQMSSGMESDGSLEEHLMGGLAAVQVLFTDAHWSFQLVLAGGLNLLMSVLQYTSAESSATALLILGALKCGCQHAFVCKALLGWSPTNFRNGEPKHVWSFGYCSVLRMLLQTKRQNVAQMACQVLHHLNAYQLASEFECQVETLLEYDCESDLPASSDHMLNKLSSSLKGLTSLLDAQNFPQEWSPAQAAHWSLLDGDDVASTPSPATLFSWISASKYSLALKDLDTQLLLVLQERRFITALAALISAPWTRVAASALKDLFLEFIGAVETMILSLMNSRSGLLFLGSDEEAAAALVSALVGLEEPEDTESMDLRHAHSLMSAGFICKTQDIGRMLSTSLSVVALMDRLLETNRDSDNFLWLLWELSVFTRSEAGRQALSSIAYFPEVFMLLLQALKPESDSPGADKRDIRALNRAVIHSAAEVMQVILLDPVASSLVAWLPHAMSLQKALQLCSPTTIDIAVGGQGLGSGNKDALCARLLDWVDAAVIFHKKGLVGLLRYVAALVVGSVTSVAVGGLPASEATEVDNAVGESAVTTELPTVNTLLGKGVTLGAAGTVLPDTAVIQLTVSMRILSSISCHPGLAAVLYGEGAMSVVCVLLEYSAGVLQSSAFDFDYMVEEDGEGDGISEMILEQERELSLLSLLLPTLLLLLSLLKRFKATNEQYRNTRLVETLLQLHECLCSRLASKISLFPQPMGLLVLSSVLRVITSVFAFWPVCCWMPSFFPKILGLNTSAVAQALNPCPLEPKKAVSVLWLLADLVPEEAPQLCTNDVLSLDIWRSLAVATLLGVKSMDFVRWHCQPSECQKLIEGMDLHLDHISTMVFQLASTASTLLQCLLTKFVVRMACQSQDHAAALLRPILSYIQETMVSGTVASENDLIRVGQFLKLLRELVRHPETKKIMIREGIVEVLLQSFNGSNQTAKVEESLSSVDGSSGVLGLPCITFDILVAICDPNISMWPKSPLGSRLARDCPSFVEYCAIASWTYYFIVSAPLGTEVEVAIQSFGKIASHQVGRAAYATVALSISRAALPSTFLHDIAALDPADMETLDAGLNVIDGVGSMVPFCKRVCAALMENADVPLALRILQKFSVAALQLSAAGRSACGLGALQLLFETDKLETKDILGSIKTSLKSWVDSCGDDQKAVSTKDAARKALRSVTALLHLLDSLPAMVHLEKKVKSVVDGLHASQPLTKADCCPLPEQILWRLLPQLHPVEVDGTSKVEVIEDPDSHFEGMFGEKFSWECAHDVSEKQPASMSGKRKAANVLDGGSKKHMADSGANGGPLADVASSVNGHLTGRTGTMSSGATSSRRDTFRQRKPNTSRPPSMHVDDYVARELGTGMAGSSMGQRSSLGGGRPPSIHVDEFMARQRDRHLVVGAPTSADSQLPVNPLVQPQIETIKVENSSASAKSSRLVMPEEDLQDVDIELDTVPDADDLLSLPLSGDLLVSSVEGSAVLSMDGAKASMELHASSTSVAIRIESVEGGRHAPVVDVRSVNDVSNPPLMRSSPLIARQSVPGEGSEAAALRSRPPSADFASVNLQFQLPQGMEVASTVGVSLQVPESSLTNFIPPVPPGIPSDTAGSVLPQQRNVGQFLPVAPLPPPPPLPAGVIPEKYEVSPSAKFPPLLPSSAAIGLPTAVAQPPPPPPPLPPPPRPSGSWQPAADANIAQQHMTGISIAFGTGAVGHVSNPMIGSNFPQAPLSTWPSLINEESGVLGVGRLAPPLPPTPPPYSSTQPLVIQVPVMANNLPTPPSPYQNISASVYTLPSNMESTSLERKFATFSPPTVASGGGSQPPPPLLPTFQPPLPPGRPNISQGPPSVPGPPTLQQPFLLTQPFVQPTSNVQFSSQAATLSAPQSFQQPLLHIPLQQLTPPGGPLAQPEQGNLLQQILASPEAIQNLLKDQNKLQSLLEQHPKLISLLQEKMGNS